MIFQSGTFFSENKIPQTSSEREEIRHNNIEVKNYDIIGWTVWQNGIQCKSTKNDLPYSGPVRIHLLFPWVLFSICRTQMRGSNIELLEVDISEIEEKIFESAFFSFQLFELIAKKQKLCSLFVNKSYQPFRYESQFKFSFSGNTSF